MASWVCFSRIFLRPCFLRASKGDDFLPFSFWLGPTGHTVLQVLRLCRKCCTFADCGGWFRHETFFCPACRPSLFAGPGVRMLRPAAAVATHHHPRQKLGLRQLRQELTSWSQPRCAQCRVKLGSMPALNRLRSSARGQETRKAGFEGVFLPCSNTARGLVEAGIPMDLGTPESSGNLLRALVQSVSTRFGPY